MYKCECGKEFEKPNDFNNHKSNCKKHYLAKYGNLDNYFSKYSKCNDILTKNRLEMSRKAKLRKEEQLAIWVSEKHICEKCGKVMTEKFGSGRFCSRSCANSKDRPADVKKKISSSVKLTESIKHSQQVRFNKNKNKYLLNPKLCVICGKVLSYEKRFIKTCSNECLIQHRHNIAIKGVNANSKRSKNEIYFYELCEKHFENVRHNEPIFNGWDADVIIDDVKYAVLWNGPWHYHQLVKNQSLKQIQNRDRIKVEEIKKYGYIPYIIKDEGQYNPEFVEQQFNLFINSL